MENIAAIRAITNCNRLNLQYMDMRKGYEHKIWAGDLGAEWSFFCQLRSLHNIIYIIFGDNLQKKRISSFSLANPRVLDYI